MNGGTGKGGSGQTKGLALLRPIHKNTDPVEGFEIEPGRLMALEDGLLNVGSKKSESQDRAVIG